ncbi:SERTA domain-containing protein 2-like [Labrus mixtus]|uniref:SERTA domain-containing protein 2-like n=1 Tax=Labrus mixtus TaxID=508554 RepID=UPI0029C04B11|nr:SERTA domain-containing protein 2-like [Labrus mixtus]
MLGNGLKRKLLHDDDCLEDVVRGPLAVGFMSSFMLRRQSVLNVSLMKLYGPALRADLRLQRRVLVNNIIRRIHDDLRQEGGLGTLFFSAAPPQDHDGYPQAPPPPSSFSILSSSLSGLTAGDSCLTPASLLEEDMFFTLPPSSPSSQLNLPHSPRTPPPLPPSPSPKDSFSSALEEIEELCPSPSSSRPPSPPPARDTTDVVMKEEEEEEAGQDSQEAPPALSSPGSFLTDFALDDVIFTDSDTSMYDLGPRPPLPSGAPPSKIAPAVMSPYGAAVGGAPNQSFKLDLAELDHIMEVLVGS